jgi:hypothetical protein
MRLPLALRIGVPIAAMCLCLQGQNTQSKDAQIEAKGMPPRATPADYLSQVQAGTVTIAAEFKGHSIPTLQGPLSTEDYAVVEVGLFGSPGARIRVSADEFSLRINGKKTALSTEPYGLVIASVKDPEWAPPVPAAAKSKGGFSGGGGGQGELGEPPPAPPPVPIGVQRAMAQRVQKATLPEGERALPQAGLIYFQYRGRAQGIRSVELIYNGPAGKATLKLQP